MNTDIFLNKKAIIERCLKRINEERGGKEANLLDLTHQDAIVLNLQRACEAAIDLAMHVISEKKLGIPQTSRDAFQTLADAGLVTVDLGNRLKKMVGFRNVAIHDYQSLSIPILSEILKSHLTDFEGFLAAVGKIS